MYYKRLSLPLENQFMLKYKKIHDPGFNLAENTNNAVSKETDARTKKKTTFDKVV